MPLIRRFILGSILLGASLSLGAPLAAQTGGATSIHIHVIEPPVPVTPEGGGVPGLSVRATFSLLDGAGAIARTDVERTVLRLGGDTYSGKFSKLESTWSVVLLMDASAALGNSRATNDFRALRDNLIRSLGGAPASASLALIPFNDRAPTTQEFTRDRDALGRAIRAVQPQANRPACLNDGLYEAIAKLSTAPGRRAVFIVTASADNCATRSVATVTDFAVANGVQLYAAGLDGYAVTLRDLEALAGPTGGLATMRDVSEMTFALDNLMAVLGNQWQAVWVLYPSRGPQTAELNVTLPDATVVASALAFVSDDDYARPPSIAIAGTAQTTPDGVRFNLDLINPERIAALDVSLINKGTGRPVYQQRISELSDIILVPDGDLVGGAEYTLAITAVDDQDQALAQTEPLDFRYEPLEASLTIAAVERPALESPNLVVTVTAQNLFSAAGYRVWLEDEQSRDRIAGYDQTFAAGEPLRLPAEDLPSGSYLVRVQALDAADNILAEAQPAKVVYEQPGAVQRLVHWMRQSTWAVAGLGACGALSLVGLIAIVWFLLPRGAGRIKTVEMALPEKVRRAPEPPAAAPPPQAAPAPPRPQPASRARPDPARPASAPAPAQAARRPEPPRPAAAPPAATLAARRTEFLAALALLEPTTVQFKAEIRKTPFSLGRRADNDGVLPMDGSSGVSGQHCVITFADGLWHVRDDKSTYGTSVNGKAIPKGQPIQLSDGVVIGLGPNVKIRFRIVT